MKRITLAIPTFADLKRPIDGAKAKLEQRRIRKAVMDSLVQQAMQAYAEKQAKPAKKEKKS